MLGLPGSAYLYQGEELGLPEATELPDDLREDPVYFRTQHKELGRDGCRVPLPWVGAAPGAGFGPSGATWLPQPATYATLAVDQQEGVPESTLELYRTLLRLRRSRELGTGSLTEVTGLGTEVVAYVGGATAGYIDLATDIADALPRVIITVIILSFLVLLLAFRSIANLGQTPVALPEGATVLVASGPLTELGAVPADTAIWASLPS